MSSRSSNLKEQLNFENEIDFSEFLPSAREEYFKALSSQSDDLPVKTFTFAMYLIRSKDPSQIRGGLALLASLIQDSPDTTILRDCYYFQALGQYYLSEFDKARASVNTLLKISPNHPQALSLNQMLTEHKAKNEIPVESTLMVAGAVALGAAAILAVILGGK